MKLKFIYHYIGILLLIFLTSGNIGIIYEYFSEHSIKTTYLYPVYIVYVSLPILVITGILFLYLCFIKAHSLTDKTFLFYWIFNLCITIGFYYYFKLESNKLQIIITNLSSNKLTDIEINARNNQHFSKEILNRGDSIIFNCKCRDVTYTDSIGINIKYNKSNNESKASVLVYSNEPIYKNNLQVLIVNDTLTFVNHALENHWFRLEKSSGLLTTQELNKIIK